MIFGLLEVVFEVLLVVLVVVSDDNDEEFVGQVGGEQVEECCSWVLWVIVECLDWLLDIFSKLLVEFQCIKLLVDFL